MSSTLFIAMLAVGGGLSLLVAGWLVKVKERDNTLAKILDLPFGERDVRVEQLTETRSPIVNSTVAFAGQMVTQFDSKGSLKSNLERARIPVKPGEFVVITACAALGVGTLLWALTGAWLMGVLGLLFAPLFANMFVKHRIAKRKRKFEEMLPDALSLIASSLSAGHTFLRAIQMMCEESEPPLAEEFARVVAETRLGDSVVDALGRMSERLQIRDLDWVVQAIRIQQTVGGRLADLLHTLADFIRARDEVRREVKVLTAEGRMSAWVLTALCPFVLLAVQFINPGYMQPMYHGVGLIVLLGTAGMVAMGAGIIFKMTKIEV